MILERAKAEDVSLIVIGTRRRAGLSALGSVSRRVIHKAPCSVLVVPPEQVGN
jgi:nucleotide-binding universal stress UspA family protein